MFYPFFCYSCTLLPPVVLQFAGHVENAVDCLSYNPARPVDENEFIEASRLVYDGVRDIRRAVLMNRVSQLVNHWLSQSVNKIVTLLVMKEVYWCIKASVRWRQCFCTVDTFSQSTSEHLHNMQD